MNILCLDRFLNEKATPLIRRHIINLELQSNVKELVLSFKWNELEQLFSKFGNSLNPNAKFRIPNAKTAYPQCYHDPKIRAEAGRRVFYQCNCANWKSAQLAVILACRLNSANAHSFVKLIFTERKQLHPTKVEALEMLHWSTVRGYTDLVKLILRKRKDIIWGEKEISIVSAIVNNHIDCLAELLKSHYSVLTWRFFDFPELCAKYDRLEMLRMFLSNQKCIASISNDRLYNLVAKNMTKPNREKYLVLVLELVIPFSLFDKLRFQMSKEEIFALFDFAMKNILNSIESDKTGRPFGAFCLASYLCREENLKGLLRDFDWTDSELLFPILLEISGSNFCAGVVVPIFNKIVEKKRNTSNETIMKLLLLTIHFDGSSLLDFFQKMINADENDHRFQLSLAEQLCLIFACAVLQRKSFLNAILISNSKKFNLVKPTLESLNGHIGQLKLIQVEGETKTISNWNSKFAKLVVEWTKTCDSEFQKLMETNLIGIFSSRFLYLDEVVSTHQENSLFMK